MAEYTVKSRFGETKFESNHTDQRQLYDRLKALISNKEIVNDHADRLIAGFVRYGSWKDYHENWAAFYVAKHDHPDRFQPGNRPNVPGMFALVAHITQAQRTLRQPTISLEIGPKPDANTEGFTLVIKLCTRGRRPGCLSVASSNRYSDRGTFYGYITEIGEFEPRLISSQVIVDTLLHVASDPARVISEIGRQSGRCCYCPAKLTQVQSKIAGCGKTCAANYDVDYPNAARTRSILSENTDYLVGATDSDRWS